MRRSRLLAPLTLVPVLAFVVPGHGVAQAKRDAALTEARAQLEHHQEAEVQKGAAACLAANSVDAVELLLDMIEQTEERSRNHLAPGHYRDIVWDALTKITDPYARARVELELQRARDPFVRQWCVELLGIYGDGSFLKSMIKALHDQNDTVSRWAARSLGMVGAREAIPALEKHVAAKDRYVRANTLEALARLDAAAWLPSVLQAIRDDSDGGVRCALLGALQALAADQVEAVSAEALRDEDWRPRLQAVDNLGAIRTKSAVDALIVALGDGRPIVGDRALHRLQALTGQPMQQAAMWPTWWAAARETFAFPTGDEKKPAVRGQTVTYNDIPLVSDHVAFMIDRSYAMGAQLAAKGTTKAEAARAELAHVLDKLQGRLTFNVFTYCEEIAAMNKRPVELGKRTAARAVAFVDEQDVGRRKDIWQVLATVVDDATLDTAYLLSSGEPDMGLYVHWNRVTRHLADLNRFHKVTIHTVAYSNEQWYRDQLQKIAEVTGGQFAWFE